MRAAGIILLVTILRGFFWRPPGGKRKSRALFHGGGVFVVWSAEDCWCATGARVYVYIHGCRELPEVYK